MMMMTMTMTMTMTMMMMMMMKRNASLMDHFAMSQGAVCTRIYFLQIAAMLSAVLSRGYM